MTAHEEEIPILPLETRAENLSETVDRLRKAAAGILGSASLIEADIHMDPAAATEEVRQHLAEAGAAFAETAKLAELGSQAVSKATGVKYEVNPEDGSITETRTAESGLVPTKKTEVIPKGTTQQDAATAEKVTERKIIDLYEKILDPTDTDLVPEAKQEVDNYEPRDIIVQILGDHEIKIGDTIIDTDKSHWTYLLNSLMVSRNTFLSVAKIGNPDSERFNSFGHWLEGPNKNSTLSKGLQRLTNTMNLAAKSQAVIKEGRKYKLSSNLKFEKPQSGEPDAASESGETVKKKTS